MKRFLHYILAFAIAIPLTSCVKEMEETPASKRSESQETATFTFTPKFMLGGDESAPATKGEVASDHCNGMSSNPCIHNIYFAVFDAVGYKLSEYAPAIPHTYADENNVVYSYSVTLTVTDEPRIIHVIANAPEHLSYGSESEVIGSLNTSFDAVNEHGEWQDAYWVRIYLEHGVHVQPDPATVYTDPDYQTKFDQYKEVVDILDQARFVRNFARLKVENKSSELVLTRYWITNFPDRGSVAPYNRNTRKFQIDYNQYDNIKEISAATIDAGNGITKAGNYQGFFPASAHVMTIQDYGNIDDPDNTNGDESNQLSRLQSDATKDWTSYVYEREKPEEKPIQLIIAGHYKDSPSESFYKIDLRDPDGEYFPLLRNFTYKVDITKVSTAGQPTISGALSAAASGDVDTSLEMQEITNISNGQAQLFISETSQVIVGESHEVELRYKFIPDLTDKEDGSVYAKRENRTLEQWGDSNPITNHKPYITISRENGDTGKVFEDTYTVDNSDDAADNYRSIRLTSVDSESVIRTETLTITGHYWVDGQDGQAGKWETISRTVTYRLREKLNYELRFSPAKVPAERDQAIDLIISLEAGLPSSIFSLDMKIEAAGLSLTTNNDPIPVSSGASIIPSNSKPSFAFTRTITWSEYDAAPIVDGRKEFICHFKTNRSSLSKLTTYESLVGHDALPDKYGDLVYVQNSYFTEKSVYFTTYSPRSFTALSLNGSAKVGEDITMQFSMDSFKDKSETYKVTIGLDGFEPEDRNTYKLVGTDGNFELYELTVASPTGNTFNLVPYESGSGHIRLYADEYITYEKEFIIQEGAFTIHVNNDGAKGGTRMVTAYETPAGEGNLVIGQQGTLTMYILDSQVTSKTEVRIGGKDAKREIQETINGEVWRKYTLSHTASNTKTVEHLTVTVDGSRSTTLTVPVYGITLGAQLTSTSFSTSSYYVIQNYSTGNYLYNNETNGSTSILIPDLDCKCLSQFGSTGSSSYVRFAKNKSNTDMYLYGTSSSRNSATTNLNTTKNNWSINYTTGKGFRFYVSYLFTNNFYIYDNSGTLANSKNSNTSDNRYWKVFPVSFEKP